MAFSYRDLFLRGKTFCCCLPVRIGVVAMSFLGILFAGILSVVLWFEVSTTPDMTSGERAGFVVAALIETFLFMVSILGFVGAIVRKQLFVQIYAYFIYIHFILNIGIAGYLLYMVTHFSANAAVEGCQNAIENPQAKAQCTGLLKIAKSVYFVIAASVLLVEMYGALVVTRYVNQIKHEKRNARGRSMKGNEEAFRLISRSSGAHYSNLADSQEREPPIPSHSAQDFDPYDGIVGPNQEAGSLHSYSGVQAPPIEVGYGGGSWTHEEIAKAEKARLKRMDDEIGVLESAPEVDEGEAEHKTEPSLSPPVLRTHGTESLPRYTLSDKAWGREA